MTCLLFASLKNMRGNKMKNRSIILFCLVLACFAGCQTAAVNSPSGPKNQARLSDAGDGVCLDKKTGLMWRTEASPLFTTWEQASRYAAKLDTAGFNDWRLSTSSELYTLYRIIDRKQGGNCPIRMKDSFWTGSTIGEAQVGFWDSEPLCGGPSYFFIKQSAGKAIAVRSSRAPP